MSNASSQVWADRSSGCAFPLWPQCRLMGPSSQERCQQRVEQLHQLGLLDCDSVPAFEEVTQQVAGFLRVPICVITIADQTTEYFKATYGLSHLGLSNPLARRRQIPLSEGLGFYVMDSEQPFLVEDTGENATIAASPLVYTYGVSAYGAVPLTTSSGQCIGTLAIMDRQPRAFTPQEVGYLAMAARWGMSEYERQGYQTPPPTTPAASPAVVPAGVNSRQLQALIDAMRLHLIGQLTQDLLSPLTAVIGMTNMLEREIYGPLTSKQREYVEIVRDSSKILVERVEDIVELGIFERGYQDLDVAPVDLEMLGQQVTNTLEPLAARRSQSLSMSIEPGQRVWVLDKRIVKQILYHLGFSIMQVAGENSTIRIHASRKADVLQLAVWLSNPWLRDGLPQAVVGLGQALSILPANGEHHLLPGPLAEGAGLSHFPFEPENIPQELLGLWLSQRLAEYHKGYVRLQGSLDAGYRFVVVLRPGKGESSSTKRQEFTQA